MARTTGPILAVGAISLANESIVHGEPINWKIPVATGIAAGMFTLAEKAFPEGAIALSWLALVAILFVRIDPKKKSPVEGFVDWIDQK